MSLTRQSRAVCVFQKISDQVCMQSPTQIVHASEFFLNCCCLFCLFACFGFLGGGHSYLLLIFIEILLVMSFNIERKSMLREDILSKVTG